MPRRNKCFSECQGLTRKQCSAKKYCRHTKSYSRSGYKKTKSHCHLTKKYRMHRNPRTKRCGMRSK